MSRESLLKKGAIFEDKGYQWDSSPQPVSLKTKTEPFSQNGQIIELCGEYLSHLLFAISLLI